MFRLGLYVVSVIVVLVESAPGKSVIAGGSAEIGGDIPSLFTFDNGNIGVNFLGFKASAGLGGLLSGRSGFGGLHAEAGTPFGQFARAGLGGQANEGGRSVGGIYADASAGGDVAAGAGLAGSTGQEGSYGMSYAGSSAGGVIKEKTKVKVGGIKEKTKVKTVTSVGTDEAVEVVEKPHKTYIERTVIPNYEEKIIYVPSYVEKTVKVPTVVEKRVKVPVAPTLVEKEVEAPAGESEIKVVEHAPIAHTVIHKHRIHSRPLFTKHFFIGSSFGGGLAGDGSGTGYGNGGISGTKTITANAHFDDWIF